MPDLEALLIDAIDKVTSSEREFQNQLGHWFSLRIHPYKTLENKIDGAILTVIDTDTIKRAKRLAENIVATMREPLLVLDANLRVRAASRSFYQLFQLTPEVTEDRFFYELGKGEWNNPDLRRHLEQILEKVRALTTIRSPMILKALDAGSCC